MGSRSFRHSLAITASAALLLAGLAVPADADRFAASAGRVDDPTGDSLGTRPVPVHEPRADLTAARAVLGGDGRIELTATVASPTDPATDPGWNDGKSFLTWGLDTTADGTPDYVVWMASGPPLEAIVLTSRMGAVDGCNPVAAYSPARYSVTISGACIGSPGTFRWNAVVYYDVSHNNDGNGATDNLVGEHGATLAPGTVNDPTGDVISKRDANDPRADITSATIAYEPGRIDLTATLARPTDPRTDPVWVEGAQVAWSFDTDGDDDDNYVAALGAGPNLTVTVYDTGDGNYTIRCTAPAVYSPTGYSVTLDPACIGSPARLWWAVGTMFDQDGQGAVDSAPDHSMAGPVTAGPSGAGGHSGYWMITNDGEVFAFGAARPLGGDAPSRGRPRVDIEPTRTGNGYWILDTFGSVSVKGDAREYGDAALRPDSAGQLHKDERAAALSATPSGNGYWIFTDRGRVIPFGDAAFLGDMTGSHPERRRPRLGRHPHRQGLLDGRLRRRHLQLRRRHASPAPPATSGSTSRSCPWPPTPTATATGSSPPTAASSPSTPPSTAPWAPPS